MTDLFARLITDGNIDELYERGRRDARSNKLDSAAHYLASALLATHSREEVYRPVAALLSEVLERMKDPRSALSLAWYTGDVARQRALLEHVPPVDRARTYGLWAQSDPVRAADLHRRAAEELDRGGLLVRAAIHFEAAGDFKSARTLWSRLAQMIDGRRDPYASGLARFNLARMNQKAKDARGTHEATVGAVHRLEEAADRFESVGQRERAFDCYHVLIAVGELSSAFEHVLEGAVNAIRILSEDNLRYHALRLQGHAMRMAETSGELSAAATIAREMTDYARKQGLARIAAGGILKQAALWRQVAESTLERGGPPELAENALLASLLANAEAGRYAAVGALYRQLETVATEPARQAHYARAAKRYEAARDESRSDGKLEEQLGEHVGPPDVWHVDLIEWEERGSAAEACADVLLDPEDASDRITRRSALVGRLAGLAQLQATPAKADAAAVMVANHLTSIGLYGLLALLEALFERPEASVRLAAVRALSRYFYKRTFVTLERALRDADDGVAQEATNALDRLRFDHAFEPLARIYRTATRPEARLAALRGIARIDVLDAAELLLGVLEHGGPDERDAVLNALRTSRSSRFFELARASYPQASDRLKASLKDILSSRGLSV